MITTLYLVTVATWYGIAVYETDDQQALCALAKKHVENNFEIEAICVAKTEKLLLVDKKRYPL